MQRERAEEGDLRLVGETAFANWQLGRLEVFFEGSWSQVCGLLVSSADVAVACRQLGFTGAGMHVAYVRGIGNAALLCSRASLVTDPGAWGCSGFDSLRCLSRKAALKPHGHACPARACIPSGEPLLNVNLYAILFPGLVLHFLNASCALARCPKHLLQDSARFLEAP